MKEFVLHFIWQHKLFDCQGLCTTDGQHIEVIDVGKPNIHEGPDFFNAKIRIGKTIWAGNVEIHNYSSDWNKHRHQENVNYRNVILHVVRKADVPVFMADGQKLAQLELSFADEIEKNYECMLANTRWIACEDKIKSIPDIFITEWKTALLGQRLKIRVDEINNLLEANNSDWEEVFFVVLMRYFGFSVNNEAFFTLAKSIPWVIILKNSDDLFKLEALLIGQAGLLDAFDCDDDYICKLKTEYVFLRRKYNLKPMQSNKWRLLRLRPDNFPYIRLAQIACLLNKEQKLFSKLIDSQDINDVFKCFSEINASEYWTTHYIPGHISKKKLKKLGGNSVNSIIVNAIVPLLFCYGDRVQNQTLKDRAMRFLESLPPEDNYIIRKWLNIGVNVKNASDTQSLIYLFKNYCEQKDCLRCRIGFRVLTKSI